MKALSRYYGDDLFFEMDRMLDRMRRMITGITRGWSEEDYRGWQRLALNMSEDDENLIVEAPVPGMTEEDVNVEIEGDRLTISGEYKREREEEDKARRWHTIERSYGRFYRTIQLPVEVDPDKAVAEIENGMLIVKLPKAETSQARRIAVKSKKALPAG